MKERKDKYKFYCIIFVSKILNSARGALIKLTNKETFSCNL
jgi:hypothetical protein